ncbi:DUF3017 domain-containing protein [Streptomyces buecherae]|uniref:DUF3017 domain-containing protein n=2 Tax=Streptomyces TaxID=1883 RepID=UPI00164E6A2F|nr:DUF3017 domain-containing protein [Streptomyces buecherae]MBC3982554.1 DUF3017 domain-containing protein [Streptomyces buecherae]MBC3992256.1 DUF3017 domain-containing protein [Streptomyces buecherae]QNJ41975.1 DUF3017 domain-containing protein [Streptomyces buecherae]
MSAHASGEGGLAAAAAGAAAQHGPRPGTRAQRHSGPGRGSRRFPRITRDTARPEGGGRAASGQAPAPARQWPLLTVMSGVAAGLLVVALDAHRAGTLVIGFSLLLGALLRWLLPSVGMLAVRSRFTDMVTYGLLGSLIVVLSMMTQPDPWLEIPFLEDLMEFTVR